MIPHDSYYIKSVLLFCRLVDFILHRDDPIRIFRLNWCINEPRLWAVCVLACFYVFIFLRVLGLTRTNRVLGPLRITLSKMLVDVFQFFAFFCLIMFAFAIGLSELFWYYGSVQNVNALCSPTNNGTSSECKIVPFSNLWSSLVNLFWSIFGYLDPNELDLTDQHNIIEVFGLILLACFYLAVIIILVNMLIAMMSKSYEVTSERKLEEYRFHRAAIWLRYIRGDYTSPTPMNLIPNFCFIYKKLKQFRCRREKPRKQQPVTSTPANNDDLQIESVVECDSLAQDCLIKYTNVLVYRYKLHKLLHIS